MAKLTPINLERKRGYIFCLAFIYTPEGTKLLTGDHDAIDKYCREHYGLCHGMRVCTKYGQTFKSWWLFGKSENYSNEDSRITLTHLDSKILNGYTGAFWKERGIKRSCWALYSRGCKERVIRTWRRLPKHYIDFKKLMENRELEQSQRMSAI